MSVLRVAVVIGKMNSGGKKNLVMEYYRHIDREKIQFDFICDSDSQSIPESEITSLGGRIYIIPPYQHIWANMHALKKICKTNNYKILHAWNSTMNLFSLKVAKDLGIPVRISESLSMGHKSDKKNILKLILRKMSRLYATHYMSCGEDCGRWQFGDELFDSGKVDVFKTVINTKSNQFEPELRERTRKRFGWDDKFVVGHIGRFTAQKNSIRLIEIFSEVVKKEPNSVLCLIGDGDLKEEMVKKISELGIDNNVDYLGKREDIHQFYNAMDCFLLPSLYEGLPVVGLEAECCGLPMFFSSEVTKEADACGLGYFIELEKSNEYWASKIISAMKKNIPLRRSYSKEVANKGFDSLNESFRLQNYYCRAVELLTKRL